MLALASSQALLDRAAQLAGEGKNQMALHLLDLVIDGTQDVAEKRRVMLLKSKSLTELAAVESSYISRSILRTSAERLEQEASGT